MPLYKIADSISYITEIPSCICAFKNLYTDKEFRIRDNGTFKLEAIIKYLYNVI